MLTKFYLEKVINKKRKCCMESGKKPLHVGKSLHAHNLTPRSLNYFITIDVNFTRLVLQIKVFVRVVKLFNSCIFSFLQYILLSKHCPANDNALSCFLIVIRKSQIIILGLHSTPFYFFQEFFYAQIL